jgi:hypothetical protein
MGTEFGHPPCLRALGSVEEKRSEGEGTGPSGKVQIHLQRRSVNLVIKVMMPLHTNISSCDLVSKQLFVNQQITSF